MPSDTREEEFELLNRRSSLDSLDDFDSLPPLPSNGSKLRRRSILRRLLPSFCYSFIASRVQPYGKRGARRRAPIVRWALIFLAVLITLTGIFRPSYTHFPQHYEALRARAAESKEPGRANPYDEAVFIAVTLYDKRGYYLGGEWGERVLSLIDLLGPDRTFLSIYENDLADEGLATMEEFKKRVPCKHQIVHERVDKSEFPTITMPDGSKRLKRLVFLSELRNRSLRPLDKAMDMKFDKILFLNDVFFEPIEAAQLLFATNVGADGRSKYISACGLDFHDNPFKFYDTFATRDLEGYSMGVPFYPFFSHAGHAYSRNDVLAQKDAVRVKSCWSGLAAFDAKYFQSNEPQVPTGFQDIGAHFINPSSPAPVKAPVRFRAEPELFSEACECCLLQADVLKLAKGTTDVGEDSGVYINPYIRVAYGPKTLSWLRFIRRFERLYSWIHYFVDTIAFMPKWNGYRQIVEGDKFKEEVWVQPSKDSAGHWELKERTARPGHYCFVRLMEILKTDDSRKGGKNWEKATIPGGRSYY